MLLTNITQKCYSQILLIILLTILLIILLKNITHKILITNLINHAL